ncbi:AfsR/SARP family transcriptional regulator [Wenjunlia tyrosinilytica]|uniref:AfsR/SARP family transcriptional regulator n=1 Tax=Wenjunlia tyrosinilytica TaxID=1544741 RepID=UPI001665B2C6|nr:BTAD domain-containing putative transcriptional regulator [Wenjunlia tyrosinilytica]
MAVTFGVLGGIEARIGGRLVELGHARQRLVLAALLVDLNREVTADQLAERVWGERSAQRGTLYSYLSHLRQALAGLESVRIARRPAGYVLTADARTVDLHRFRGMVAEAGRAADEEHAAALLEEALGLWRGDALRGLDTPWANSLREVLHQERLAAELDATEIGLRLERHTDLLPRLRTRAREHPLDERLAGQLVLALHRCGRTAEALKCYESTRQRLADELGIDPGPSLKQLHHQVLTCDPAVTPHTGPAVTIRPAPAAVPAPVPRQLPAPPALFTGRAVELAALSADLDQHADRGESVVISAITGKGGIGKTYLALRWAYNHLERFPDGQLYVNLRGFDPSGEAVPPPVAIRGFLGALGVEPSAVPVDPDAQAALYRSLVAGKRMLIVLDNALDTAQVTPLLPGSPSCAVLVTSRRRLGSLVTAQGARLLTLCTLSKDESPEVLTRHLGEARIAAEPEAVNALLRHCGGHPLALSTVAARAAAHPDFPLSHLAAELAESANRLDALDADDIAADLRAVFSASYQALEPDAAHVFTLLGMAPGPDISPPAAAALANRAPADIRTLLHALEVSHLVRQQSPGRYQLHDLVRLFAVERARQDQHEAVRPLALRRLVDFYLHTADRGSRLADTFWPIRLELEPPIAGSRPHPLADAAAAGAWFDAEHMCLLAAQQLTQELGWHTLTWQLAESVFALLWDRNRLPENLGMWRAALAAAEQLDDPSVQALARLRLGLSCGQAGRNTEALDHLGQALTLFEQTGDAAGQGSAHFALGWIWDQQGVPRRALSCVERSLSLHHALGDAVWEARILNAMGWSHARLGRYQQAHSHCARALAVCRSEGDRRGEVSTLDSLGYIAHLSGRHGQALDHYHQALSMSRELSRDIGIAATAFEANVLAHLGDTYQALNRTSAARHCWRQALDLYRTQHRTAAAARVQAQLDACDPAHADARGEPSAPLRDA